MPHYDRTCDSTEEWSFLNYHKDTLKKPDPSWHFDHNELHAIAVIYYKLQRNVGCDIKHELPIKAFDEVMHKSLGMVDDALIQRVFNALDQIASTVSLNKWIGAMSLFLRGTLNEQIRHCFKVYDFTNRGEIRREQMIFLMRKFVFKEHDEDVDEAVKDFVDILIKKMDVDRDGIISFADYNQTVLKHPMLLECFGQCLPDQMSVITFQLTFTDKIKV